MSVTMNALVTELSKQINDWFEGTADTNATNPTYTLVDTALAEKQADWITSGSSGQQPTYLYIKTDSAGAGAAPEGEERIVAGDITVATGTVLTSSVYPFSASIASGDTYEFHRIASRGEKERAITYACNKAFPHVYKEIQDQSIVFNDWLSNGDFEKWTASTYPDNWVLSTLTASECTTEQLVFGLPTSSSMKFAASGAAGSMYQSEAEVNDFWKMAGKTVYFYAWVYTTGTSEVSLGITDGTTTTYGNHTSHASSSKVYHPGDSTWRLMYVWQTIADNPTTVKFTIYYDTSDADAYIDKACALAGWKYTYDISLLGLYQNTPSQILALSGADASDDTPEANPYKTRVSDYELNPNGTINFKQEYRSGKRFEVIGMGYLTPPVSKYGGGTAVSTEINDIDQEGQIVIAEAAKYLFTQKLHAAPSQDIERYKELVSYWTNEARLRRSKYAMKPIPMTR